ncbi:MAG: Rne/Rng family ribonuclease [Rhizobiaceae bacterium]|nr:Rne/Rng family ribonuclease [Rhizobiaceae bacterium]
MPNKMLIDASHPEETRVVVVRGNRIEEFDFESQDKKQLRGNIYLARVTRVEPSLQAAFVEYGGNRHGFLAFSEIHPDYYQIPVADRQALLRAEAEDRESDDDDDGDGEDGRSRGRQRRRGSKTRDGGKNRQRATSGEDTEHPADDESHGQAEGSGSDEQPAGAGSENRVMEEAVEAETVSEIPEPERGGVDDAPSNGADADEVEMVGAEDALEEARDRRKPPRRHYKIQEVIKRRQIMLVQVVKEERGNKGAALTTYLSLAGRYSVLMPNTARGGGISRKITNATDRKRLKDVVKDLDVPQGMGVILRTAGENRTKAEIKRDYEYLMRLWENVRNLTLKSTAPALVYEEGSLIKRSVRDLYNKDIDEILVAGEDGYREAKDFMRMLMPSHAKMVQPYRDPTPIFARNGIEAQLDRMLQPQVTLKSGGYIIINQTEALVSIDVNSGRSTKEHSIEDTALQTNLEAAEEVARQLRLRDLAGLIVIDFIDMEENRNNRSVEKRLKDHLKNDRARIQVGRISHFGLLEMSRQRIRASVLESTMKPCPHCGGTGHVRSDSSVALMVVRAIEEFLLKDSRNHISVRTPSATALYVLNHKRQTLVELEMRFGLTITVEADESVGSQHYAILRGAVAEKAVAQPVLATPPVVDEPEDEEFEVEEAVVEEDDAEEAAEERPATQNNAEGDDGNRKRRRRRRRRGGRDRDREQPSAGQPQLVSEDGEHADDDDGEDDGDEQAQPHAEGAAGDENGERKKRRRGKRGGRRRHREDDAAMPAETVHAAAEFAETSPEHHAEPVAITEAVVEAEIEAGAAQVKEAEAPATEPAEAAPAEAAPAEAEAKPKRARRTPAKTKKAKAEETAGAEEPAAADEKKPARKPRAPRRKAAAADAAVTAETAPAADHAPVEIAPIEPVVDSLPDEVQPQTVETPPAAPEPALEEKPKKAGWWQRKGFF